MPGQEDDDYETRLKRTLALFSPLSEESRRKLVQVYESIDEVGLSESA